jgi:hypothetical protein
MGVSGAAGIRAGGARLMMLAKCRIGLPRSTAEKVDNKISLPYANIARVEA